MKVDSVEELESAFLQWRRHKKHARERVPEELLVRARRAAKKHGLTGVVRVTRIERSRLFRNVASGRPGEGGTERKRGNTKATSKDTPAFSRLELSAPSAPGVRPLAEVETGTGVRLRVFEETPEMLRLLAAACGIGAPR